MEEGHQKTGGVLYAAVAAYFTHWAVPCETGKDSTGHPAGAFYISAEAAAKVYWG